MKAFTIDIAFFIKQSISKGFGIILSMDSNKNMNNRRMQKLLSKLRLSETTSILTNDTPPPRFHKELKQIDVAWISSITKPITVSIAPF